jgi:mannose-6-phosphate isomerase-like protein (cupin superfamily)
MDLVVVDTHESLLVVSRYNFARVSKVVETMTVTHYPEVTASFEAIQAKPILISVGEKICGEVKRNLSPYWIVLQGRVTVTIGNETSLHGAN